MKSWIFTDKCSAPILFCVFGHEVLSTNVQHQSFVFLVAEYSEHMLIYIIPCITVIPTNVLDVDL